MESRQAEAIPEAAAAIYSSKEILQQYVANLELTASWYNKVIQTVLEVEYPLVQGQIKEIDARVIEAEKSINWRSEGKLSYCSSTNVSHHVK